MQKKSNFIMEAGPLLLVLFIDGMGLGLVIPILNGLMFDPHTHFLATASTPTLHNIIYGAIIGIFMLCWFFGAAILGDLSDQIGRKKALIICLVGAFLSYVLSGFAVTYHSLTLLLLGRVIAGFTSGSQPIAQAAIIDLSTPETKARNIGIILLALSLGFVFGPLLGGVLADSNLVSWFDFSTPFYFAALSSFLNIILLLALFKETFVSKSTTFSINPYQAINIFVSAFQDLSVRNLSIIFFVFIFGWSSFYSFISLYLLKVYAFTPTQISLMMALMGVGFGIGNGFLANFFARNFPLRINFLFSNLITAIFIGLMLFVHNNIFNWLMMAPVTCAVSVAYTSILTIFSNQVEPERQGWVMGITGSVMAFVWAVNGVLVGILAAIDVVYPLYVAIFTLVLASVMTIFLFTAKDDKGNTATRVIAH